METSLISVPPQSKKRHKILLHHKENSGKSFELSPCNYGQRSFRGAGWWNLHKGGGCPKKFGHDKTDPKEDEEQS